MRKVNILLFLLMINIVLLLSCNHNESSDTEDDVSGVYVKSAISLNTDFIATSNIQLHGDMIYFCGMVEDNSDYIPAMFKMNPLDSSIEYDILTIETSPYLIAVSDNRYIFCMAVYDMNTRTESYTIQITDKDYNMIFETQISDLIPSRNNPYDQICVGSTDDQIYIASNKTCVILDEDGKTTKTYNLSGNVTSLQVNSESNLYIIGNDSNYNVTLDIIDIKTGKQKDGSIHINDLNKIGGNAYYIGNNDTIYIRNETDLIKYNFDTKKSNKIMNWVDSGFFAGGINTLIPIDSETFLFYGLDVFTNKNIFWRLDKVLKESVQERTVIKVSYMEDGRNIIPMAAIKFNSISTEYQVVCEDYRSVGSTDNYDELLSAYDAALLTGNLGDVLILANGIEYERYANKGAFSDIYEIIENDPNFSLDILYDCVKKPYEIDGKLYVAIPEFTLNTLVGKTKNLPKDTWNIKTMLDLVNSLSDEVSLIEGMTRSSMFNTFLLAGASEFINMENGTCSFDSDEFISLIEYIASFPETINQDVDTQDIIPYLNDDVYLYESIYFGNFLDYLKLKARFGFDEDINMIGYPSKNGGATEIIPMNYYAISSASENQAGAWEFIKYLLSGDTIINEIKGMRYIPSSRDTLRDWVESEQMLTYHFPLGSLQYRVYFDPEEGEIDTQGYIIELNDEFINEFDKFLNSISYRSDVPVTIMEIISEDTNIYFSGNKTAIETAKIIQNRVSTYLHEGK